MMPASAHVDSIDFVKGVAVCAGGVCTVLGAADAQAGYGAYTVGQGTQSTGAAGIVYSLVQDTTPLSSNPALARLLGTRIDFTVEYDGAYSDFYIRDNLLGGDADYRSDQRDFFFPQAGMAVAITDQLSLAMTGFIAGFGSQYKDSPFRRFGGDKEVSLALNQVGVSTVLAAELAPEQNFGISLNLSYDMIEVKGVQGLALFSETPEHFSDQGRSGVLGLGFTLGWYGRLTPWLRGGLGYRSKTFGQGRFEEYEGLLPQQGTVEFPSIFGGGLAWMPASGWTLALDVQRVTYSKEPAFNNSLSQISQHRFGSDQGPGFGWISQNIFRLATTYAPDEHLTLRAGVSHGTQQMRRSDTLFGSLAPNTSTRHYSIGGTWTLDSGWEFSAAASYAPSVRVRGEHSIPPLAGGGEADVKIRSPIFDISVSRNFDFSLDSLRVFAASAAAAAHR